ncbi:MAG TPA: amidase [Thermoleophilia bacterium]|nr:amidase [Thermoleophilia bacterium]
MREGDDRTVRDGDGRGTHGGLWELEATALAAMLRAGAVSAREVVSSFLQRIDDVDGPINAIPTLVPERALADADDADGRRARGDDLGPLHGLPIAVKDLVDTAGIRTTYGSPIYRDHVPAEDALLVQRLRRAGAIVIGKTNTPEFGAGSQTFNPVFGATRNPYDTSRTAGGSTGGGAAAVAAGMLPFADGSDMGGSLRNPASFCNVIGLRPTPGRVPELPADDAWDPLSVSGPIARTVGDLALLLGVLAGPDPRAPLSLGALPALTTLPSPAAPLRSPPAGLPSPARVRVAWSRDLGGLPIAPEVTAVLEEGRRVLDGLGWQVEEAEPDLRGADEVFEVLRALSFVRALHHEYVAHRESLKDTVAQNIEAGLRLTPLRIAAAQAERAAIFARTVDFFSRFDVLAAPATQVAPFPVEKEWVDEIDGHRLSTYTDWMRSCSRVTVTAHPAVSVPCGFTADGLPVGLQLVGRYGDEAGLLAIAERVVAATGAAARRPAVKA